MIVFPRIPLPGAAATHRSTLGVRSLPRPGFVVLVNHPHFAVVADTRVDAGALRKRA